MILNDRQAKMVEVIKNNKRVSVKKLSGDFFVSEMTIRRDLKELEKAGYIQRYNGGAVYLDEYETIPIESRKLLNIAEKKEISKKADKYINDFITVFIDSSSTALYIIPFLKQYKEITVVTNSVQCILAASKYHLKCILAGGNYYENDMCTVGSETDGFLRRINVDVGFFSSRGLSDDGIISDNNEMQTSARRAIMMNCKKKIFLFDHSKQNRKYIYTVCTVDEVDDIIII